MTRWIQPTPIPRHFPFLGATGFARRQTPKPRAPDNQSSKSRWAHWSGREPPGNRNAYYGLERLFGMKLVNVLPSNQFGRDRLGSPLIYEITKDGSDQLTERSIKACLSG